MPKNVNSNTYSSLSKGSLKPQAEDSMVKNSPNLASATDKYNKNGEHRVANEDAQLVNPESAANTSPAANPNAAVGAAALSKKNSDFVKNSTLVDRDNDTVLGKPKVYDSVGEAGSGFVNMSHLLGLNQKSGNASAKDFAARTKGAGQGALAGIQHAEDDFYGAAAGGMSWDRSLDSGKNAGISPTQDQINKSANAAYTGPDDLASMGGYSNLSKQVSDAENMAKNTQDAYGVAAQVNKETGLSPIQSAASSFYMGVNNPNIKKAGAAFTNLSQALEKANSRALASSTYAKQEAKRQQSYAPGWQAGLDASQDAFKQHTLHQSQLNAQKAQQAREIADRQAAVDKNHRRGEKSEIVLHDDYTQNTGYKGMPGPAADAGETYEEWVAEGSPDAETWMKMHPNGYNKPHKKGGR